MAYNSYVVIGEKVAVADTVDARFVDEWLGNVETALDGRTPDYLVMHHMEPDHSAGIVAFMDRYPDAQIVASKMAFKMMAAYFVLDFSDRQIACNKSLSLILAVARFVLSALPTCIGPSSRFPTIRKTKCCFPRMPLASSAQTISKIPKAGLAKRAAINSGIVGKFGKNVQAVLRKVAAFDVECICPLHGPVLSENLAYYVETYTTWAHYEPENSGVAIAYASVYGHTKQAAEELARALEERGQTVSLFDLARDDMAEAVEDAFRYDRLVLASITYAGYLPVYDHVHPYACRARVSKPQGGLRRIWHLGSSSRQGHACADGTAFRYRICRKRLLPCVVQYMMLRVPRLPLWRTSWLVSLIVPMPRKCLSLSIIFEI